NTSARVGKAWLDTCAVCHRALVSAAEAEPCAGGAALLAACGARQLASAHGGGAILRADGLGLRWNNDRNGGRKHQRGDEQLPHSSLRHGVVALFRAPTSILVSARKYLAPALRGRRGYPMRSSF